MIEVGFPTHGPLSHPLVSARLEKARARTHTHTHTLPRAEGALLQ